MAGTHRHTDTDTVSDTDSNFCHTLTLESQLQNEDFSPGAIRKQNLPITSKSLEGDLSLVKTPYESANKWTP